MSAIQKFSGIAVALAGIAVLAACGGSSPAGPSGQGVSLQGIVVGSSFGASGVTLSSAGSASSHLIVTVEEDPNITAVVGDDGTFILRGLPEGSFTLIFTLDGVEIGRLTFDAVLPNQELTLTVDISDGTVTVLEERRDGIGHGDIEIQGDIDAVVEVNPAGDSRFLIDGYPVIVRPGTTAIREGNARRSVEDLEEGQQVHVKGVWMELAEGATTQDVLAHEIKLQNDDDDDDNDDNDDDDTDSGSCMINGGKVGQGIQLQGTVASGSSGGFMMNINGNRASGPVEIDSSGASFKCSGKTTDSECKAKVKSGQKIHVSGNLTSCDASSALVNASEVKPQGK